LKFPARWKFGELKQRLVLTSEEKRVIAFILAAFVLGLAAKHYRDTHPQPPTAIDKKHPYSRSQGISPSPSQPVTPTRKKMQKPPNAAPFNSQSPLNLLSQDIFPGSDYQDLRAANKWSRPTNDGLRRTTEWC
jgi:hypothetical protein